jgi:HEAT repeats
MNRSSRFAAPRSACILSLTLLGWTGYASAVEPAPQESATPAPAQASDEAREAERMLHLSDGRVVRARSRFVDGTWQVQCNGEWSALPEEAVESVKLARDVVSESKRLAKEVPRDDLDKRVALADWMLREGLVDEALDQLDRVLRVDPDQASALKLLAEPPQPLSVAQFATEDPEALVKAAAGAPPAVRELAIQKLAALSGAHSCELLRSQLTSPVVRSRAFAAVALRRLCPSDELRPLAVRSLLDGSEEVRLQANLSLKAANVEAAILPAVRALSSKSEVVRANAIESLGTMGYPAAVEPLVMRLAALQSSGSKNSAPRAHIYVGKQQAYIQDFDVEVAQGAAIADPMINTLVEGTLLDARVIGVTVFTTAVESQRIRSSLAKLTGEERSAKGWLDWWALNSSKSDGKTTPTTGG